MLDKSDQMAGGKTAAGAKAAAGGLNSGPKGSPANSGPKGGSPAGGGKMGASSSQSGGVNSGPKSSGAMGARSANAATGSKGYGGSSGGLGSNSGAMGARSANAATGPQGYGGASSRGGIMGGGLGTARDDRAGPYNGGLGSAAGPALAGLGDRPFGSYAGPKGTTSLNQASRIANTRAQGYGSLPTISASPGELDLATRVALAESSSIKNAYGRPQTAAIQAIGDVMKNRAVSGQYPDTLGGVVTQPHQFSAYNTDARKKTLSDFGPTNPDYAATKATLGSIMSGETAPVVGKSVNYANQRSVANPKSISSSAQRPSAKSQKAFAGMEGVRTFTDASNPAMQHTFGTIGTPAADVMNGSFSQPSTQYAAASPKASPKTASGNRVAEFAAKGKPATGASARVADFAGRGKPVSTSSVAMASIPAASQPWERAQGVPQPNEVTGRGAMLADALGPGYQNPGRSYAGIPSNGLPGYENPGRTFADIPSNGLPGYQNPGRSFADVSGQFPGSPVEQVQGRQTAGLPNPLGYSFGPGEAPAMAQNPARSFAGIPGNGLPGYSNPSRTFAGIPGNGLPGYENPGRSFAGIPQQAQPQQAAYSDPADFARSPLGQAFSKVGAGIGAGFSVAGDALRQFEENKGVIGLAKAVGYNPIGKAVKTAATQGIKNMQASLAPIANAHPTQVAGGIPTTAQPQISPGVPGAMPPEVAAVQRQRSTLMSMLQHIMGNGGPKTQREQRVVRQIAQTLASTAPASNGMDYSITESAA